MINATRARAEARFAQIERRQQTALSEQEEAAKARRDNSERLKALRLARDEQSPVKSKSRKSR